MGPIFYVYGDYTDSGRPYYFGKGKLERIKRRERNIYWKNISKKHGWNRIILMGTKNEDYAFEVEISCILQFKTFRDFWKDGSGWGANLTKGGDGTAGRSGPLSASWGKSPSKESRKRMSEAQKNRICSEETRIKMSKYRLGKTCSEESRKNMSEGQKGRVHSEETKLKLSKLAKKRGGRPHSEETKKKLSQIKKGKSTGPCSEKAKIKLSKSSSGENNPSAKLTWGKVNNIRELIFEGKKNKEISELFKISLGCVADIKKNRTWKI